MRETSGKCGGVGAEMENDRELLELAAKAVGCAVNARMQAERDAIGAGNVGLWIDGVRTCWDPLADHGDALRLAVKLGMKIFVCDKTKTTWAMPIYGDGGGSVQDHAGDERAATRRAIVCAAAEVGRAME